MLWILQILFEFDAVKRDSWTSKTLSARRGVSAHLPVMAQLSDQIERTCNADDLAWRGLCQGGIECLFRVRNDFEMCRMMAGNLGELRRRDGTGSSRLGKKHLGCARKQDAGKFVDGFVAKRAENQDEVSTVKIFIEESCQFSRSRWIVGAIEINVRIGVNFFDSTGPDCASDSLFDVSVADAKPLRLQNAGGGYRVQCVLELKAPGELRRKLKSRPSFDSPHCRTGSAIQHLLRFNCECAGGFDHTSVRFARLGEKNFANFFPLFRNDDGNAGLDDSRFFTGDFAQRVAEKIFVVKVHARNNAELWCDDICGIQPSAEARLKNRKFDISIREVGERHRSDALEKCGMGTQRATRERLFDRGVNPRKYRGEQSVGHFFSVHANAFIDSCEVRRSVQAGAVPRGSQNRFEEGRRRAFAVGARNVNGRIFSFGVAEAVRKYGDVFKIELRGRGLRWGGKLAPQREQVADRFLEVHFNSSAGRARMRGRI